MKILKKMQEPYPGLGCQLPHGRATQSGHLCETVKRERVVGPQLASRAERCAESVQ